MNDKQITVLLDNWSTVVHSMDPYIAPELNIALRGKVYGHLRFEDGSTVVTSSIIEAAGRFVKTKNTVYELGEVNKDFLSWCKDNNVYFDLNNPFGGKL